MEEEIKKPDPIPETAPAEPPITTPEPLEPVDGTAKEAAPAANAEPIPTSEPEPAPESDPTPEPELAPGAEPAPEPELAPGAEPAPEPSAGVGGAVSPSWDARYETKYAKQYRAELARLADGPEKDYLLDRVFPQMEYYSKNSAKCKKAYHALTMACIICNGVIPLVLLFEEVSCLSPFIKYFVTALSSTAGILTAITALKQHRELWIQYRVCLEQLKRAVNMYFMGVGEFGSNQKTEERSKTLFAVCENILNAEHKQWTALYSEQKKPDDKN